MDTHALEKSADDMPVLCDSRTISPARNFDSVCITY